MEENKPIRFWDTPDGKIMSHTVHEHNTGLGTLRNWTLFLKGHLEKNYPEILKDEKIQRALDGLDLARERMKTAVDYSYTKFKERYESESEN